MSALAEAIGREIEESGPIPVSRFMELALAHPEHGYYRSRDPLGRKGDFVTAPEVSQMFGEMLGLWAAVTWQQLGAPHPFTLAELGPGRGTLMADALRAAHTQPGFIDAARLHLVETSPVLARRQEAALSAFAPVFCDTIDDLPDGPMIVIANEFFDALPIRQLVATAGGWAERRVTLGPEANHRFIFCEGPLADPDDPPAGLPPVEGADAIFELCPAAQEIAGALGARAGAAATACLIIDYGHARSAPGDTLQAVRGHRYADPLAEPGTTDLTAHVDFEALGRAARDRGAAVFGPIGQGAFLEALGIGVRAERLAAGAGAEQVRAIEAARHRLIAPDGMGTLFKALALTSPGMGVPAGFETVAEAAT